MKKTNWTTEDYSLFKRECERMADSYGWLDMATIEMWAANIVNMKK